MKNKGFTLIEVLGVIVILSMLVVIGVRSITNIVKKSKIELSELQIESIKASAKALANDNILYLPSSNKCKYITLDDLYEYGYFEDEVIDPKNNEEYNNIYVSVCANRNELLNKISYDYELKYLDNSNKPEFGMNPFFLSEPDLYGNKLTPIVYVQLKYATESSDFVIERNIVVNSINEEPGFFYKYEWQVPYEYDIWYDYDNQMWANAVILNPNVQKNPGDTVDVDPLNGNSEAVAMFVWIPRFSYTIKCENNDYTDCYGNYDYAEKLYASSNIGVSTPGAIDVKFVAYNIKNSGSAKYYGNKIQNWYTIPAFTLISSDNETSELDGIWIGKFESSDENQSCYTAPQEESLCNRSDFNINILPNSKILRYLNFDKQFINALYFDEYLEKGYSHLIKNSEWASAAYLTQSIYGKYGNKNYRGKEKQVFNSNTIVNTGISLGGVVTDDNQLNSVSYSYDGYLIDGNTRDFIKGIGASTSGSIYGIYGMNGGSNEFVSFYSGDLDDEYYISVKNYSLNNNIDLLKYMDENVDLSIGQAIHDTSGWYNSLSTLNRLHYLLRGYTRASISSDVFAFGGSNGTATYSSQSQGKASFRVALFNQYK